MQDKVSKYSNEEIKSYDIYNQPEMDNVIHGEKWGYF